MIESKYYDLYKSLSNGTIEDIYELVTKIEKKVLFKELNENLTKRTKKPKFKA